MTAADDDARAAGQGDRVDEIQAAHWRLPVSGQCAECTWGDGRGPEWPCDAVQAATEARARLAASEAREAALRAAFIKHRTATHEVAPKFCKTCRESDAILARPAPERGAALLAVVQAALVWAKDRQFLAPDYEDEEYPSDELWRNMIDALRALAARPAPGSE